MAQSVKCLTLDFGSGHDVTVHEFEPCIGFCTDGVDLLGLLSLLLSAPPLLVVSLSL